jgi:NCS1 family nucleobase:cation symporter-1
VVALSIDISQYTNFLYLIGAIFIPLSGALIAAWLATGGRNWNVSTDAPFRPGMAVAWALGFVIYQVINPGAIPGWSDAWTGVAEALHLIGHPWLSASLASFLLAFVVALPIARSVRSRHPAG